MSTIIPAPDYIGFLVTRRFKELREPPSPLAHRYGFDNGIVGDDELRSTPTEAVLQAAETYRQELVQLTPAKLKALYEEEFEKKNLEDDQRRFFNEKKADADFEHWSRMPHWTLDEAIALSLGKAPEVVFKGRLKSILSYLSPFVARYQRLHDLAERAVAAGQLTQPTSPGAFIRWTEANGLDFPQALKELVAQRGHDTTDWKQLYETHAEKSQQTIADQQTRIAQLESLLAEAQADKPLKTRERDTAYKIILGMAMQGYRYDPNALKNVSISEIAGDIELVGLSVDQDTIRRWLQKAAELLNQKP